MDPCTHQRINIQRHKIGRHALEPLRYFIGKAMFQRDVAPLDVPKVSETFNKCRKQWPFFLRVTGMPQNSIFGMRAFCCARATSGHVAAVPLRSVINSRRLTASSH